MDWATLFSTFVMVLVAELGDKTQLAVIAQVCKHRRPLAVFWGASLALTAITGLGVALGRLLGVLVPPLLMRRVAGAAFIGMGLLVVYEFMRQKGRQEPTCVDQAPVCDPIENRRRNWMAFSSTFGLLFVAELGDKTQLAALSMASKTASPWSVFIGATSALAVVTALGVALGQGVSRLIPERVLRLAAAVTFVILGGLIWFGLL